jgi:hypothetical protein
MYIALTAGGPGGWSDTLRGWLEARGIWRFINGAGLPVLAHTARRGLWPSAICTLHGGRADWARPHLHRDMSGHICTATCLATSATALLAFEPIGCSAICQCGGIGPDRAPPHGYEGRLTRAPPHLCATARITQRPAVSNIPTDDSIRYMGGAAVTECRRSLAWIDGWMDSTRVSLALVLVGLLDFVLLVTVIALAVARNEFASADCVRILARSKR